LLDIEPSKSITNYHINIIIIRELGKIETCL